MLQHFHPYNLSFKKLWKHPFLQWAIRICVAWWLIGNITPITSRAPLGDPHIVEAEKSHVCVHTLLENEVFEWKIQRSLELVREMGADTIVQFFPWAYFEPNEDQYDWRQADLIVRHAENQGLRVIARLGFVPWWARPDIESEFSTLNYLTDDRFDDFADYAALFAERYAGVIDHIIIWNEPNLTFEWGYRPVDPSAYVRLLQTLYPRIKEVNPNAVILAGALAPNNEVRGSTAGLSDLLYLEDIYKAGGADYFDALAIHTYGFTDPPQAEPSDTALNFRRAELLHDIMLEYDEPDTPVFITESGWNDHVRWTKAVRPSQRSIYTVEAFQYTEENWDWLDQLCIWVFRYPAPINSYPDNFTLVTPEFKLKPIYYAIQAYARGWQRSDTLWLPPPEEKETD